MGLSKSADQFPETAAEGTPQLRKVVSPLIAILSSPRARTRGSEDILQPPGDPEGTSDETDLLGEAFIAGVVRVH